MLAPPILPVVKTAIVTTHNRQSISGHLTTALVPDVLQRRGDVDLLGALGHAVEHHIDENIGARAAHSVTEKKGVMKEFKEVKEGAPAVDDHGAGATPVGFVDFPEKMCQNVLLEGGWVRQGYGCPITAIGVRIEGLTIIACLERKVLGHWWGTSFCGGFLKGYTVDGDY